MACVCGTVAYKTSTCGSCNIDFQEQKTEIDLLRDCPLHAYRLGCMCSMQLSSPARDLTPLCSECDKKYEQVFADQTRGFILKRRVEKIA
jgi:hypothetical protein